MSAIERPPSLKAACAAATVVACWGVSQSAQAQVEVPAGMNAVVQVNFTNPVSDLYLLYNQQSSGIDVYSDAIELGVAAAGPGVYNVNLVEMTENNFVSSEFYYSVVGVYSDPTNPDPDERSGISLTLEIGDGPFDNPIVLNRTFDEIYGSRISESALIDALQTDDITTLESFGRENQFGGLNFNELGTQINFSEADFGGTALLTIPEPAAGALLAFGAIWTLGRRRREA